MANEKLITKGQFIGAADRIDEILDAKANVDASGKILFNHLPDGYPYKEQFTEVIIPEGSAVYDYIDENTTYTSYNSSFLISDIGTVISGNHYKIFVKNITTGELIETSAIAREPIENKEIGCYAGIDVNVYDGRIELSFVEPINTGVFGASVSVNYDNIPFNTSIYIYTDVYKVHKLDPKYLPDGYPYVESGGSVYILPEMQYSPMEGAEGILLSTTALDVTVGETYTVNYNGISYDCIANEISMDGMSALVLGNSSMLGGSGNGEPFAILIVSPEMIEMLGFGAIMMPFDGVMSGTISIAKNGEVVHKLDPKYLPDGYPYVEDGVLTEIIPETTLEGYEGRFAFETAIPFVLGETYTVKINGVEYTCVAQDMFDPEAGISMGTGVGDFGMMMGGASTGEPFIIATVHPEFVEAMDGIPTMIMAIDGSSTITFSISGQGEVVHKIDTKYLPDGMGYIETFDDVIMSGLPPSYDPGLGMFLDIVKKPIAGLYYNVTWGDTTYQCLAQNTSFDFMYNIPCILIGSSSPFGYKDNDTGEPFGVIIFSIPVPLSDEITVTGMIRGKGGEYPPDNFSIGRGYRFNKLDERCLPDSAVVESKIADKISFKTKTLNIPDNYYMYMNDMIYADDKFVIVANNTYESGGSIVCSTDGINNWSSNSTINADFRSIAYGNGKFVAIIGDNADYCVSYSTDCTTWSENISIELDSNPEVIYLNDKFIIYSGIGTTGIHYYSSDGIAWTRNSSFNDNLQSIAYGNGIFVGVSYDSLYGLKYSTDGINWESVGQNINRNLSKVVYGDGKFVAIGHTGETYKVIYSTDGINWSQSNYAFDEDALVTHVPCFIYGNKKFILTLSTGYFYYSENGNEWYEGARMPFNMSPSHLRIAYDNEKFVAISDMNDVMTYSYDGINWYNEVTGLFDNNDNYIGNPVMNKDNIVTDIQFNINFDTGNLEYTLTKGLV